MKQLHASAFLRRMGFLLTFVITCNTLTAQQKLNDYKVSLSLSNRPLKEAINDLQENTGLAFTYFEEDIRHAAPVSLSVNNAPLDVVLDRLFTSRSLAASLRGNKVFITPAKPEPVRYAVLKGSVRDAANGQVLPYATVRVKGTEMGATADKDGDYLISNLRPGSYTIVTGYIGFVTMEKQVSLSGGETMHLPIMLESLTKALGGVTISGIRRGEVKALNSMRNADNIKYVLSAEQIEKFPDNTVAESLQRVPGVAVGYSYGVARDVIIRGLDPTRNAVNMNGNRVPATETQSRTTDLNGVLSNTVEAIEIIKTLTPDRDADATGGVINIITKSAQEEKPVLAGKALVGYNGLTEKANYDLSLSYGRKKNKFGYLVSGSYFQSTRGQDRIDISYADYEIGEAEVRKPESITYEAFKIDRKNLGLNIDLNYDAGKNTNLYLRAIYNKYYEFQYSGSVGNSIGEWTSNDQAADITIYRDGRWRDYHRDIFTLNLGGKSLAGKMKIAYDINLNKGLYDQPKYWNASFNLGDQSARINLADPSQPVLSYDGTTASDLSNYTTRNYINRHERVDDKDAQASFNAIREFSLGKTSRIDLKFGGRYRYKTNERFRNYYNHVLLASEDDFKLSDFLSDYKRDNFLNDFMNLNGFPETERMEQYFQANKAKFSDDPTYTRQNTDPDSYKGKEDMMAAYVMGTLKTEKLDVVAGVRFERTSFDYKGNQVLLDETGTYISTTKIDNGNAFHGFYPSLNLKYKISNRTNLRAAVTRSLSRPNYYDLVPWQEIERRRKRINQGNPDLVEEPAINYDLLGEHYFKSIGLLSGGVFYKNVNKVLFDYSYEQKGGEYDGYRINTKTNGGRGKLYGFEVAWQQQFTFLPGFLNGFGIYTNYTYIQSELTTPTVETARKIAMPEMRPHVGNVSLTYEKFGFSGRVSSYFFASYLTEVGDIAAFDTHEKGRMQLDFSASQQIGKHFKATLNLSNLTRAKRSDYFGSEQYPLNTYVDGWWGSAGISFRF
ncbi:TonB-dependent receptor [Chitinophaga horti]|uniref:TonB-dependent receptor n=1 Tax=Chitinophaga horti TaxID=2920382 RepID=A0ABY6IY87_9BACT|nr:TonB-dependent receptor [Chitinophaga horti]UYQ92245.1 TonB-dependent receptor [Chitinophaga horti]